MKVMLSPETINMFAKHSKMLVNIFIQYMKLAVN